MLSPLIGLSIFFHVSKLANAEAPTVALKYGVFQGTANGNLSTFLGVPFAQPAVRFELPRAPKLLHGIQNATVFGPACPQQALSIPAGFPPGIIRMQPEVSEDCLQLNVFAPRSATPRSGLPVLVWFFGGGWVEGSSSDTDVGPLVERSIATGEPIIIVTPNYRLSAFGYLGGKEVIDAGISNLGSRDQIFALEWVQEHISEFGGNPAEVVIAGAVSTALLLLSNKRFEPTALFRGAFMMSGSPITAPSVADGQADYDELVAANDCAKSQNTLDCLRHIPLDAFKATVDNTTNFLSFSSLNITWRPRVDGDVIPEDPLISVSKGLYAKIPIMTGDADDEGTIFSLSNTNITTSDEFLGYIHSNYFPKSTPAQITEIAKLYPDDPTQAPFQGDYFFIGPRRLFLQHASQTQNTWSWLNKRGKTTPILGAAHEVEVGMWFPPANVTDFVLADAFINFINTLDPNYSSNGRNISVFWPKWSTPLSDGSPPLFTLSDPNITSITPDNFRTAAIGFLNDLLLTEAVHSG
ncbi:Carboxylic ester hydrolase [Mycena venus]|uniref:Carboxylic ester hydrolase n=1 Tax=Mycena venus TaxID=2733690 RepID=A0A8H7CV22_9AGAR|nr:Carboxylic ester hydrolase [Mycena venus]